MPYTLNRTDGSVLTTLADGTKNDSITSLTFIGKNFNNYGEAFNENFLRLLEHFSSQTPPSSPSLGQLWFDKTNGILKVYQGPVETWKVIPVSNTILGTSNQITANPTASGITLSLPQNIHNQATPTFRNLTLNESAFGVPPLAVNSSFLVSNLNADLLDGQQGSYYSNYNNLTNKPSLGTIASLSTITLGTDTTGNYVTNLVQGSGIAIDNPSGVGSTPTIRHAATSIIAPTVQSSNVEGDYNFIKNVTFTYDSYGHATTTAITSAAESNGFKTVVPYNTTPSSGYTWVSETSPGVLDENKRITANTPETTLEIFAGQALDIRVDNAKKAILIDHSDTSSVTNTNNINGNVIRNLSFDTHGHVTAVVSTDLDTRYFSASGGSLSGFLILHSNPTADFHAATKQYVDQKNSVIGYVIFYASTGAIYNNVVKNVTVSRYGVGNYRIYLNAGIQSGSLDYVPVVSSIGNTLTMENTNELYQTAGGVWTHQSSYFDVYLTQTIGYRQGHAQDDIDTSTYFYRQYTDNTTGDGLIRVILVR